MEKIHLRLQKFRMIGIVLILLILCIASVSAAENYTYFAKWGTSGPGDGQGIPSDVALDSSGNVYVPDLNGNRIQKFTSDGTFVTKWGVFGDANGQFKQPQGVAVDSQGMSTSPII